MAERQRARDRRTERKRERETERQREKENEGGYVCMISNDEEPESLVKQM